MHLNDERGARPHQRRQVLEARICLRFSVLDKTGCDQCALRRDGIFNKQIEVVEWTVGWNRIVRGDLRTFHQHDGAFICGPGLAKNGTREHGAHCSCACVRKETGRNLASLRSPESASCEVQTMLAQRLQARRSFDKPLDDSGEQEVIVDARQSMRGCWASH